MPALARLLSWAQPTWGLFTSELRLRAMLNLGMLFNETVFLTDTQAADNPQFFQSFLTKGERTSGAFGVLAAYVKTGSLKILLRDNFYLPNEERSLECENISDVYHGWKRQGLPGAWVVKDLSQNREMYVGALDDLLKQGTVLRYCYLDVKRNFASKIRSLANESGSLFGSLVQALPDRLRDEYLAIVSRPYFTHSELYDFITRWQYERSKLAIVQGLIDEISYAEAATAGMFGPDNLEGHIASVIWETGADSPPHADALEAFAERIWRVPSIRLVGLLHPEEVLSLRRKAGALFEVREIAQDIGESELDALREGYLDLLESYWNDICDLIATKHPEVATVPIKTMVSAGRRWRHAPLWLRRIPSLLLDIPVRLLPWQNVQEAIEMAKRKLSLRILLSGESAELTKLRRLVPANSWMAGPVTLEPVEGHPQRPSGMIEGAPPVPPGLVTHPSRDPGQLRLVLSEANYA